MNSLSVVAIKKSSNNNNEAVFQVEVVREEMAWERYQM